MSIGLCLVYRIFAIEHKYVPSFLNLQPSQPIQHNFFSTMVTSFGHCNHYQELDSFKFGVFKTNNELNWDIKTSTPLTP